MKKSSRRSGLGGSPEHNRHRLSVPSPGFGGTVAFGYVIARHFSPQARLSISQVPRSHFGLSLLQWRILVHWGCGIRLQHLYREAHGSSIALLH